MNTMAIFLPKPDKRLSAIKAALPKITVNSLVTNYVQKYLTEKVQNFTNEQYKLGTSDEENT